MPDREGGYIFYKKTDWETHLGPHRGRFLVGGGAYTSSDKLGYLGFHLSGLLS